VEYDDGRLSILSWKEIAQHARQAVAEAALTDFEHDAHPACH
jgi:hypothetical protein